MEIGASLHEARVRRRLTVDDAHRATRIRPQYLEALEEEDFERLPGDAYVKGFLRSYADYLELDGSALVATYRERNAEREPPPAAARPSVLPPPSRSRLAVGAVAGALAATAALGWALAGDEQERPPPPSAAAPAAPSAAAKRSSPAAAKATSAAAPSLALAATRGDSWLEVRFGGASGKLVWTGTLRRGRTLRLGLRRALWIRAGAPEALAATIGGRRLRFPPGAREVVAEAEGIRAG